MWLHHLPSIFILIAMHTQAADHETRNYDFSYTPPPPSEWKQDKRSEDVSKRLANSNKKVELDLKPSKEDDIHVSYQDKYFNTPPYIKNQSDLATYKRLQRLNSFDCHGNPACFTAQERLERKMQRLHDKKN